MSEQQSPANFTRTTKGAFVAVELNTSEAIAVATLLGATSGRIGYDLFAFLADKLAEHRNVDVNTLINDAFEDGSITAVGGADFDTDVVVMLAAAYAAGVFKKPTTEREVTQ